VQKRDVIRTVSKAGRARLDSKQCAASLARVVRLRVPSRLCVPASSALPASTPKALPWELEPKTKTEEKEALTEAVEAVIFYSY
jgi:hypothetical protein